MLAVGSPLIRIEIEGAAGDGRCAAPPSAPAPPRRAGGSHASTATARRRRAAAPAPPPTGATVGRQRVTPDRRRGRSAAPAVRAARRGRSASTCATSTGTGPDGRIVHADLDAHLRAGRRPRLRGAARGARAPATTPSTRCKIVGLRRKIAQRMQHVQARIPHFTYVEEVDVTELEALRAQLNAGAARRRAAADAAAVPDARRRSSPCVDFPQINARFDDEDGVVNRHRRGAPRHRHADARRA